MTVLIHFPLSQKVTLNFFIQPAGTTRQRGFQRGWLQEEPSTVPRDDVRIYNRALSDSEVQQLYEYESGPRVNLIKAVKPSFSGLSLGTNYLLQLSGDLNTWTNHGSAFTATNASMIYPQYWDVDNWGRLFFRLQVAL